MEKDERQFRSHERFTSLNLGANKSLGVFGEEIYTTVQDALQWYNEIREVML